MRTECARCSNRRGEETRLARGRPRSREAQAAILDAAGKLLFELGIQGMSMDGVAERAGVSKATIYRWWASKELVALDALLEQWRDRAIEPGGPDTGSLRGDLFERGEIRADTDVDAALDMLYGPIYHRLLHGHAPLDEPFIRQVVETLADGLESRVAKS